MRRSGFVVRLFCGALIFGSFLISTVWSQQAASTKLSDKDAAIDYRTQLEKETFSLINDYRKAHDLPVLKWNGDIADVARGHSKDMATGEVGFGHEGFGKRVAVLQKKMVGVNGAGENVFETDSPDQVAQMAVKVWLNSPHHLANIRGDFNYSGIGVWKNEEGGVYFTQVFVKIQPRALPAAVAPEPQVVSPYTYLAPPSTR